MNNIIDFRKEKDRVLKSRAISNLQNKLIDDRKRISNEVYLLSKLYGEGSISNIDIVVSFNGMECYYGEKSKDELYLVKDRIDNIKKEIKFK